MDSFYIIIALLSIASLAFLLLFDKQESHIPDVLEYEANPALEQEMELLLNEISTLAKNEEERMARYKDIKSKYREAFNALGQEFPKYK